MKGTGSVVMLEGDTASINGRDRTDAFANCMKTNFPNITVQIDPNPLVETAQSGVAAVIQVEPMSSVPA